MVLMSDEALNWARQQHWILGSNSPRRHQFLKRLGLTFTVVSHGLDEERCSQGVEAEGLALFLAQAKLRQIREKNLEVSHPILCADTVVILDNQALGQPLGVDQAREFLRELSGREHRVVTALAVGFQDWQLSRQEETRVQFASLDEALIQSYLQLGEWKGAAGAYQLQENGELLVDRIVGSPSCVAGLPLRAFYEIMRDIQRLLRGA